MGVNDNFPIDEAQIGVFMEAVFYGIYLVTFVKCMKFLLWADGAFKPLYQLHYKMLVGALLMFIFGTLDVAFHLRHNLDAFVGAPNPQAVLDHFNDTSNWINVMKMVAYVLQTFVGDAILLYRCWIIYGRNWMIVALPAVLWLGGTVCGAMTIYVEATLDTDGALLNAKNLIPFITSMLSLTLAMNILTTGLIVHRIWRVQRRLNRRTTFTHTENPLSRVLVVLIESGLMYTISIVILFGLYMAGHNGQYGVSNAVTQIIGITFNLIITSADSEGRHSTTSGSASGIAGTNRLALHQIHVSTVTSRFPDFNEPSEEGKSSALESPPTGKDWK